MLVHEVGGGLIVRAFGSRFNGQNYEPWWFPIWKVVSRFTKVHGCVPGENLLPVPNFKKGLGPSLPIVQMIL